MIVSKTPLRVSFLGGGTDYPSYFDKNPGAVLGTTINQYVYINALKLSDISEQNYRLTYRQVESVNSVSDISHPVVRECLKFYNVQEKLNIGTMSDLPGGTGLGSSSSFTVGFINLLHKLKEQPTTRKFLAESAIHLERNILNENVGVQDQYHAAFGGLSKYEFAGNSVSIVPLNCTQDCLQSLNNSMILVYTDLQRRSSEVMSSQESKTKSGDNDDYLKNMYNMVNAGIDILERTGDDYHKLRDFGELLQEGWEMKKKLGNKITNDHINEIYEFGMKSGAWGGKLLGAGGGGFVLFLADTDTQLKIKNQYGNKALKIHMESNGTQVYSI